MSSALDFGPLEPDVPDPVGREQRPVGVEEREHAGYRDAIGQTRVRGHDVPCPVERIELTAANADPRVAPAWTRH